MSDGATIDFELERDAIAPFAPSNCSANPSKSKRMKFFFSSAHVEWGTPPDLRADLEKEFGGFTLDPCTPGQVWDGCAMSWAGHRVFCNPPYGQKIKAWLAKGGEADLAVFLLPARTDAGWFHDEALKADEIRFFRGRLKFVEGHIQPRKAFEDNRGAPFPSMLVIYRRQDSPNKRICGTGNRE